MVAGGNPPGRDTLAHEAAMEGNDLTGDIITHRQLKLVGS
jgi:hypothetical protein